MTPGLFNENARAARTGKPAVIGPYNRRNKRLKAIIEQATQRLARSRKQ